MEVFNFKHFQLSLILLWPDGHVFQYFHKHISTNNQHLLANIIGWCGINLLYTISRHVPPLRKPPTYSFKSTIIRRALFGLGLWRTTLYCSTCATCGTKQDISTFLLKGIKVSWHCHVRFYMRNTKQCYDVTDSIVLVALVQGKWCRNWMWRHRGQS